MLQAVCICDMVNASAKDDSKGCKVTMIIEGIFKNLEYISSI